LTDLARKYRKLDAELDTFDMPSKSTSFQVLYKCLELTFVCVV
jgi:hypothetical protein